MHIPSLVTLIALAAATAASVIPDGGVQVRAVSLTTTSLYKSTAQSTTLPTTKSSTTSAKATATPFRRTRTTTKAAVPTSKRTSTTIKTSSSLSSSSSSRTSTTTKTSSSSSSSSSLSSSSKASSTATLLADAAAASCTNGASTRSCWGSGYNVSTDFDVSWPTTGTTVTYNFEITNTTLSPDGVSRMVLAVNGQYPGPTIYANWGDTIVVTVQNSMPNNGTSMHWHGIRQYHNNPADGVPGITECPIAPGQSATYTFQATQYGTSWYHSHFSAQYGDGVLGPMVIYGPATANYDYDLGPLPFTDWYYTPVQALAVIAGANPGNPPAADTGLINGTMVSSSGGSYAQTTGLVSGKKYRLRLINTSVDNHFMVSLDGHPFEVITNDMVPIKPYSAEWIFMAIGQRYDVIITANQTVGNYWFRAEVQSGCGQNTNNGNIKSIFSYANAASGDPTSSATTYTGRCTDETQLVPFWDSFVPTGPLATTETLDVAIDLGVKTDGDSIVAWGVNFSDFSVEWDKPILQYVLDGNTSYPKAENLIELNDAAEWYYWIIQASSASETQVPHPIHLHGHDFYVLGTGYGTYTSALASTLNYDDPTRRDVAMLNSGGWLAIAFKTNNPGAWIMHCHIAWHAGEGLAVQFLESSSEIQSVSPYGSAFEKQCAAWDSYYPSHAKYLKDDSGI